MTGLLPMSLLEQQVGLVRSVLERRSGMGQHLRGRVIPHLDPGAQDAVREAVEVLDNEGGIEETLACSLDVAVMEIRNGIAAGTFEEKVAIPQDRLIGCAEAFDTHRRLTPDAEALQAALPPLEDLCRAVQTALDFAEAVRLSLRMLDQK
mgnify:CR=1 FL=1